MESLCELAYLGSNQSRQIDDRINHLTDDHTTWVRSTFRNDLFLDVVVDQFNTLSVGDTDQPMHTALYVRRIMDPPLDVATVELRQAILRELDQDRVALERTESLYNQLVDVLDALKAIYRAGSVQAQAERRLDLLRRIVDTVDFMRANFDRLDSQLSQLSAFGRAARESSSYRTLAALLEWEGSMAELTLKLRIDARGRIRQFRVADVTENATSNFYQTPWGRWVEWFRLLGRRYSVSQPDVVARALLEVFRDALPLLLSLLRILGEIEFYIVSRAFAQAAVDAGSSVCLPDVGDERSLEFVGLVNPLLIATGVTPIAADFGCSEDTATVVITGPNSGGKTRLLQSIAWAQLLAQSGGYVPAVQARVPMRRGIFVALAERPEADAAEGRLGAEVLRIRDLAERAPRGSLVLVDELCAGTNPSEAIEVVSLALQVFKRLHATAIVSTHFLELARQIDSDKADLAVDFAQALVDQDQQPTFQFGPGIAATSLASATVNRLASDRTRLTEIIDKRLR